MVVKINATFSKDNLSNNGLSRVYQELIDGELLTIDAVCVLELVKLETDIGDDGYVTPTVRIVAIEPIQGENATTVRRILDECRTARTGTGLAPTLFDNPGDLES